jgi:hypothetical protein
MNTIKNKISIAFGNNNFLACMVNVSSIKIAEGNNLYLIFRGVSAIRG